MIHTPQYVIEQRPVARIFPHIQRLMDEHAGEMAHYPALMRAAPDEQRYQQLEDAGLLRSLVLLADSEVVGYAASVLVAHPHHSHLLMLMNDALFVSKEHRKGLAGVRLMRAMERCAKESGASLVTWNAQPDTPLAALLPRIGYREMNTTHCKEV